LSISEEEGGRGRHDLQLGKSARKGSVGNDETGFTLFDQGECTFFPSPIEGKRREAAHKLQPVVRGTQPAKKKKKKKNQQKKKKKKRTTKKEKKKIRKNNITTSSSTSASQLPSSKERNKSSSFSPLLRNFSKIPRDLVSSESRAGGKRRS